MISTITEKRMAKKVLSIVSQAVLNAMRTIDAHDGRFIQTELNLHKSLGKRRYIHTADFWEKQKNKSKVK